MSKPVDFISNPRVPLVARLPDSPILENLRVARERGASDILVGDLEWAQLKALHAKSGQILGEDESLTMAGIRFIRVRAVSSWVNVKRV